MSHVHPPPSKVRGWRRPIEIAVLRGRASSRGLASSDSLFYPISANARKLGESSQIARVKYVPLRNFEPCQTLVSFSLEKLHGLATNFSADRLPVIESQKYPQFLFRLDTYIYFVGTRPNRSRFKMGFDLNMPEISIGRVPPN